MTQKELQELTVVAINAIDAYSDELNEVYTCFKLQKIGWRNRPISYRICSDVLPQAVSAYDNILRGILDEQLEDDDLAVVREALLTSWRNNKVLMRMLSDTLKSMYGERFSNIEKLVQELENVCNFLEDKA